MDHYSGSLLADACPSKKKEINKRARICIMKLKKGVSISRSCFSVPARIVNISKNVSVNEGENVNLYCLAVGRPEPTVTWKDQKCKLHRLVCSSWHPDISRSHFHIYTLPSLRSSLTLFKSFVVLFFFHSSGLGAYQHSTRVRVFISHSRVIILTPSCSRCPGPDFMLPYFPNVPMFRPQKNTH